MDVVALVARVPEFRLWFSLWRIFQNQESDTTRIFKRGNGGNGGNGVPPESRKLLASIKTIAPISHHQVVNLSVSTWHKPENKANA